MGYEHIRNTGKYRVVKSNSERIAFVAHQGFGIAFLSVVFDISYPILAKHFDMCHAGITAIEFEEENGYVTPKILTLFSMLICIKKACQQSTTIIYIYKLKNIKLWR